MFIVHSTDCAPTLVDCVHYGTNSVYFILEIRPSSNVSANQLILYAIECLQYQLN